MATQRVCHSPVMASSSSGMLASVSFDRQGFDVGVLTLPKKRVPVGRFGPKSATSKYKERGVPAGIGASNQSSICRSPSFWAQLSQVKVESNSKYRVPSEAVPDGDGSGPGKWLPHVS